MKTSYLGNSDGKDKKHDGGFALMHTLVMIFAICAVVVIAGGYVGMEVKCTEKMQNKFYVRLAEKNAAAMERYENR